MILDNIRKIMAKEDIQKELVRKYKNYREVGRELHEKIMQTCLDRAVLLKAARLLGIARGDTLILENEEEVGTLMDFTLHDYKVKNKNTIEIYKEKAVSLNETEKEILEALLLSYTSLFKIVSVSKKENSLLLSDLLNKKDDIKLIDIAFSKHAVPGLLLFTRLVPFKDFNMTTGAVMAFPGNLEDYIIKNYKKLSRKVPSDNEAIKRYVTFFKLSKTHGIEVRYK